MTIDRKLISSNLIHVSKTIFKHELLRLQRSPGLIVNMLTFLVASLVVFHLAVGPFAIKENITLGYLLVTIYFSMLLAAAGLYQEDIASGFIEQYILTGAPATAIVLAKLSIQILYNILFVLSASPIAFVIMQLDMQLLVAFYTVSSVFIIYTAIIMNFVESLSNSGPMQKLLLNLPFSIAALALAALGLQEPHYLLMLLSLTLVIGPIFIWATAKSLKE
jgi:heme exporter protein CcmB